MNGPAHSWDENQHLQNWVHAPRVKTGWTIRLGGAEAPFRMEEFKYPQRGKTGALDVFVVWFQDLSKSEGLFSSNENPQPNQIPHSSKTDWLLCRHVSFVWDVGHSDVPWAVGCQVSHHGLNLLTQFFGWYQDESAHILLTNTLRKTHTESEELQVLMLKANSWLADGWPTCLEVRMCCITGMAYDAVFPDPVLARARTSFPSRAKGMAFSWIRVGWDQPRSATAWENNTSLTGLRFSGHSNKVLVKAVSALWILCLVYKFPNKVSKRVISQTFSTNL